MAGITLTGRYYRLYPRQKPLGHAERELELRPRDTVFLIVDVYGLGADPDDTPQDAWDYDSCYYQQWRAAMPRIAAAKQAARRAGFPTVYVSNSAPRIDLADSAYQEVKSNALNVNKDELFAETNVDPLEYHQGDADALKYSRIIAPDDGDYYIRKHVHSAFFDTRLDTLLRNLDCRTLVCAGFALDMCLGTTMIDALWRNYRVVLLRDCTAAVELPGVDDPGAWTDRWILYTEYAVGYTATSEQWIGACDGAG